MKDYKSDKSIYENDIIDSWIEKDEDEEIVSQRYRELSKIMSPMYDFILAYSNYFSIRRDYGYGPELTMVEIHILTDIHDHPDTTVDELIAFDNICKEYTNILRESTKKEDDWLSSFFYASRQAFLKLYSNFELTFILII